jgi:pterin-4a-carbinolamine dehydratase
MFSLQNYNFEILAEKNCGAFLPDTKALTQKEVSDVLDFIFMGFSDQTLRRNRWKTANIGDALALNGRFSFDSYQKTFAFVSAVYLLSLKQNYYPDIMFGDGFCYITLFTIKLKGIHENDFIMLAKIESMIGGQRNLSESSEFSTEEAGRGQIEERKIVKKPLRKKT